MALTPKQRSQVMKDSWAKRKVQQTKPKGTISPLDAFSKIRISKPGALNHQSLDEAVKQMKAASDGSSASYYTLPEGVKELQDLIAYRNMNAQLGEVFRAAYRYGECPHSPKKREIKKIIFYAQAELARLEKYEDAP